jgi:hypothetical protein
MFSDSDSEYDYIVSDDEGDSNIDGDSDNYDKGQLNRLSRRNPRYQYDELETNKQYKERIRYLADEENTIELEKLKARLRKKNSKLEKQLNSLRTKHPRKIGETDIVYNTRIAGEALKKENPDIGFGQCSVCSENFQRKDVIIDAHPLDNNNRGSTHRFHKDCILPSCITHGVKRECPLCRRAINCEQIRIAGKGVKVKKEEKDEKEEKEDEDEDEDEEEELEAGVEEDEDEDKELEAGVEVIMDRPTLQGGKRKRSRSRKNKRSKKLITKKRKGKKKYSKKRKGNKKRRATKRKY